MALEIKPRTSDERYIDYISEINALEYLLNNKYLKIKSCTITDESILSDIGGVSVDWNNFKKSVNNFINNIEKLLYN